MGRIVSPVRLVQSYGLVPAMCLRQATSPQKAAARASIRSRCTLSSRAWVSG